MYEEIYNYISQNTGKKEDLQSTMSNSQPNRGLKVDFQKAGKHKEANVSSRQQTPQGKSVAKHATPLSNILDEDLNVT